MVRVGNRPAPHSENARHCASACPRLPVVALTIDPIIGIAMGAVISALALPAIVYWLHRFKFRGLWFLLVLPIALSPVFIFFAMLCNAEPHQCNGWTFEKLRAFLVVSLWRNCVSFAAATRLIRGHG